MYKLIIFDLDGTLLDTSEGILSSVKYTITKFKKNELTDAVLKTFVGPPIQTSFLNTYNIDNIEADKMADEFRNHYKNYDLLKAKPYVYISKVLEILKQKGLKLAVATYKRQDYAETIIQYFGFTRYIDVICGSDFEGKLSKTDIIIEAIKKSNVENYKDVLMIGDTIFDANGASNVGIDFLGVTYGFGFKDDQYFKDNSMAYVAKNATDILNYILRLEGEGKHESKNF